ncbi:unnamed protein product [Citrullus colocynthis]|uniref:Iron-binding zinc finger CDGSH type domain-containing protein n=1 Tax=Citrullus colocynthis TaxID=252529 RepID=A0ABP0XWX9_9ROSI
MASILPISAPSSLPIRSHPPHPNFNARRMVVVRAEGGSGGEPINPAIRKAEDKVVDSVVIDQLSKPLTPYCRCWRSATFPLCDGSHVKHNKATGDNVGPLLLKK